jgi:hypothetical protein
VGVGEGGVPVTVGVGLFVTSFSGSGVLVAVAVGGVPVTVGVR